MRLPQGQAAREQLAVQYGRDGYYLLGQVHAAGAPGWLAGLPAVRALRLIWIQQYYRDTGADGEKVIWREAGEHGLPPGRARIVSPYDLDARYAEKHGMGWIGCKVFLSESLAGDDPATGLARLQVITNVDTTCAAVADVAMTTPVHDQMHASGVTPGEHAVDQGFMSGDELVAARQRGITLLGPLRPSRSAQIRAGGYAITSFTLNWDREQATCHQRFTSTR